MNDVFATLAAKQQQRQNNRKVEWVQFVIDVADGQVKDADDILEALERYGKTASELQVDVDRLRSRRELARQVTEREAAEVEYTDLQRATAAADKELEQLIERHNQKHFPTQQRLETVRSKLSTGVDARRALIDGVSRETREAICGAVEAEFKEIQQRQLVVGQALADVERWLGEAASFGETAASADRASLPAKQQQRQRLRAELATIERELQSLVLRRSAAEQELLRPELF
jgi:hypothetical protein